MRSVVILLCLLTVTACTRKHPTGATGPVDRQVVLAPGGTAVVDEAAISLRFDQVLGDSRCPADAFCIQGGDAIVRIEVLPSTGGRHVYDLHTGDLRPAKHADLTIELVQLAPYPFSSQPIQPGDYRATLRVTR